MSMSAYEGMAFRDGRHWHEGCRWGSLQSAFERRIHAAVGDDVVRVGVHKTLPRLYIRDRLGWAESPLEGRVDLPGYVAVGVETPGGGPGCAVLVTPDGTVWTAVGASEIYENWCDLLAEEETG